MPAERETVLMGRDLDVSVPVAAATSGVAVIEGLAAVFVELVEYARAGDLVIDWASLTVGIEQRPDVRPTEAGRILPPLSIRARITARRS